MKEVLVRHGKHSIFCVVNGIDIVIRHKGDKFYYKGRLKSEDAYQELKDRAADIYESYNHSIAGFDAVSNMFQTGEVEDLFDGPIYSGCDPRTEDEITDYMNEAWDKVWLMRSEPCEDMDIEARRLAGVKRILRTYDDIPDNGYTDWECGYWNGILGALRWVLGDEKDFLDT